MNEALNHTIAQNIYESNKTDINSMLKQAQSKQMLSRVYYETGVTVFIFKDSSKLQIKVKIL
jgi:hypothetical protein